MADIFGVDSKLGGIFKGSSFKLTLAGGSSPAIAGSLVQQIDVQYQRQIQRVWELGSRDMYYVEGHTEGQASLQQIVGPTGLVTDMVQDLGKLDCDAAKRRMTLSAVTNGEFCSGATGGGTSLTINSPVASSFTLGASAENFVVNAGIQIMFTGLSLGGGVVSV